MNKELSIKVVTYKMELGELEKVLKNVQSTVPSDVNLFLINNGLPIDENFKVKMSRYKFIENGPENKHLSKTWNYCVELDGTEWSMVCNDDIELKPGWYEVWKKIKDDYDLVAKGFSIFIIRVEAWKTIGGFDEGLKKIGFEDDDFYIRAVQNKLRMNTEFKGFKPGNCSMDEYFIHWHRDARNKYKKLEGRTADLENFNAIYFKKKWGTIDSASLIKKFS